MGNFSYQQLLTHFDRVIARLQSTALRPPASVLYVLKRMAQTFVPNADTGSPAYISNSCHARVAKAILKRGNLDDRVYLFGTPSEVMHSVLTDENNKVLVDAWPGKFDENQYTVREGETLDLVYTCQVSDIYDMFQR